MKAECRSSRLSTAIFGFALVAGACGDDALSPSPATPALAPAPPTSPPTMLPAPAPPPTATLSPPPPAPVPPSPPPSVQPAVPKDAILVVGNAEHLSEGEEDIIDILIHSLLFNLVTVADDSELARDFDPGLVIISSSVNERTLNDEWNSERVPVLVMSHAMYPVMGIAEHGVLPVVDAQIFEPDHPIVREFDDRLGLLRNAQFGVPPDSATIIVGERGNRRRGLIFAFEGGDTLASVAGDEPKVARQRRLGFFASTDDVPNLTADEEALLMNSLLWTWSGQVDGRP